MNNAKAKQIAVNKLGESWAKRLWPEFTRAYMQNVARNVAKEREKYTVYPESDRVFKAFHLTPFDEVKVVIVAQDPYHNGRATGLAFANRKTVNHISPSLKNIFKELEDDLGDEGLFIDQTLKEWAKQGVLLLNTTLTVRENEPGSHSNFGWHKFTGQALRSLNEKEDIVFLLWGNHAQSLKTHLDPIKHVFMEASHPSPFSAHISFLGSKPFSRTNEVLKDAGKKPIEWFVH